MREAARHTFAVEGYAATSTEELARRAGISTKTLYRLFPGKAALFEAMCADRLERLLSDVNLQADNQADIETSLAAVLVACADLALDPEVVALQRMVLRSNRLRSRILPRISTGMASRAPRQRSPVGSVSARRSASRSIMSTKPLE